MRLQEALRQGFEVLEEAGVPSARLAAEVLLMHALNCDRTCLYAHPERALTDAERVHYGRYLNERMTGKPTQYIIGRQEFWGLEFRVTPAVLIPRPETEHVVERTVELVGRSEVRGPWPAEGSVVRSPRSAEGSVVRGPWSVVNSSPARPQSSDHGFQTTDHGPQTTDHGPETMHRSPPAPAIIDVGTGSGCIAVALASELPGARLFATDISRASLAVAAENAQRLVGHRISFCCMDLLAGVGDARLDLVVSNPPYVPAAQAASIQREVRGFEPSVALFGGEAGTEVYARLVPEAARVLRPGGWAVFELGFSLHDHVRGMFGPEWADIEVHPDLAGIPRVISARKK